MNMPDEDRYSFVAEWYDPTASVVRSFLLIFFPKDLTVELHDLKNKRIFLKRSECLTVSLQDLYLGNTVNVYSRQLQLVDYGDLRTKERLHTHSQRTFAMIKPDGIPRIGRIVSEIEKSGLKLSQMRMLVLEKEAAEEFYQEHRERNFFRNLVNYVTGGPVLVMELMGEDAVKKWRDLLGPTDSEDARRDCPASIRAQFGTNKTQNAGHGSDSPEAATRELDMFFPSPETSRRFMLSTSATFKDCCCCVIKPHIVQAGLSGQLIADIQEAGFIVSALEMFRMDSASAAEFLEVYKGVVAEYPSLVNDMTSGSVIAMEITSCHGNETSGRFREFVGPHDSELARLLRPDTLRAKYGRDKVKNGVHCTDLPEDGQLEVEYFFKVLQKHR